MVGSATLTIVTSISSIVEASSRLISAAVRPGWEGALWVGVWICVSVSAMSPTLVSLPVSF